MAGRRKRMDEPAQGELAKRTAAGENPFSVARELGYAQPMVAVGRVLKRKEFLEDPQILAFLQSQIKITMLELKDDAFRWYKLCLNHPNIEHEMRMKAADSVMKLLSHKK